MAVLRNQRQYRQPPNWVPRSKIEEIWHILDYETPRVDSWHARIMKFLIKWILPGLVITAFLDMWSGLTLHAGQVTLAKVRKAKEIALISQSVVNAHCPYITMTGIALTGNRRSISELSRCIAATSKLLTDSTYLSVDIENNKQSKEEQIAIESTKQAIKMIQVSLEQVHKMAKDKAASIEKQLEEEQLWGGKVFRQVSKFITSTCVHSAKVTLTNDKEVNYLAKQMAKDILNRIHEVNKLHERVITTKLNLDEMSEYEIGKNWIGGMMTTLFCCYTAMSIVIYYLRKQYQRRNVLRLPNEREARGEQRLDFRDFRFSSRIHTSHQKSRKKSKRKSRKKSKRKARKKSKRKARKKSKRKSRKKSKRKSRKKSKRKSRKKSRKR